MTQEVVTATEVAAPTDIKEQLPDAQLICDRLDEALAKDGFGPTICSPAIRLLFQQAWAVASHKQNTQVSIYHLAFALAFNEPEAGEALASHLDADVEAFAVGCMLKMLSRGVPRTDRAILSPAVAAVRWVGEAIALSNLRGDHAELLPGDLVRAVLDGRLLDSDRNELRQAARIGKFRHDTVLGHRPEPLIAKPGSSTGDIIQRVQEFEKGETAASASSSAVANLLSRLDEFDERHTTELADQKEALARIESSISDRLAVPAQPFSPNDDIMGKLETIDQHISDVQKALPKPPSALRLAAALVAVLAVGVSAGLALSPNGAEIAQAAANRMTALVQAFKSMM